MIKGIIATIFLTALLIFLVISIGGCDHDTIQPEDKFILGDKVQAPYGYKECEARGHEQCR